MRRCNILSSLLIYERSRDLFHKSRRRHLARLYSPFLSSSTRPTLTPAERPDLPSPSLFLPLISRTRDRSGYSGTPAPHLFFSKSRNYSCRIHSYLGNSWHPEGETSLSACVAWEQGFAFWEALGSFRVRCHTEQRSVSSATRRDADVLIDV